MWIGSCPLRLRSHLSCPRAPWSLPHAREVHLSLRSYHRRLWIRSTTLRRRRTWLLVMYSRLAPLHRRVLLSCPQVHHPARAQVRRGPWTLRVRGLIRPMAMLLRPLDSPHCGRGCVCLVTPPFFFLMYRVSFKRHGSHEPHISIRMDLLLQV